MIEIVPMFSDLLCVILITVAEVKSLLAHSSSLSQTDDEERDVISKLTRNRAVDLSSGLCDSLQAELREHSSDTEDLSDFDLSYTGSGLSDIPSDTPTDTQTDGNEDTSGSKKTKKRVPINAALKEKIRQELTGPSKFDDPAMKKMMEKRAMRYSVAVTTGHGGRHLVELGTSVHATVARNLSNDVFTKSKDKNSDEYLQMLRERKKSRAQLTKAHTIAEKCDSDEQIEIQITDTDLNLQQKSPPKKPSPEPRDLASPPKLNRSMPTYSIDELLSEEEEEGGDVISKLVGRTALLSAPSRSRKVSLQEELCGRAPQAHRSMRTSVAGDIVKSADSSPANKEPINAGNPHGGLPNIPGLIIPDKWKQDFSSKKQVLSDTSISPSSDTDLSESDAEFDSRINLNIEPSPSLGNVSTKPNPPAVSEPSPDLEPTSAQDTQSSSLPELNPDFKPNSDNTVTPDIQPSPDLRPNPAFLGYELTAKSKTLSNSESDKDDSTDEEAGKIKPVRVKRRKSSSERRRSQPELDLIAPGDDSEDEPVGSHYKPGYKLSPRSSLSSSQAPSPKPEPEPEVPSTATLNPEETVDLDHSLEAFLESETEDMLIEVDKHEPIYAAQSEISTPETKCEEQSLKDEREGNEGKWIGVKHEGPFKSFENEEKIEVEVGLKGEEDDEENTMRPIKVETRDVPRSLVLSSNYQSGDYSEGESKDSPSRAEHSMVEVGRDGKIIKKESSPFKYVEQVPCSPSPNKELTEEGLKAEIRGLQEEMAKSDLIIAELNITIEDLREYNTKLEHDIFSKEASQRSQEAKQLDFEQSDEWLNLEIEVARLQKEVSERDSIIRTQKDALDKTLSKGGSPRQVSLAGAARQALDINVSEMAKKYNEALILCKNTPTSDNAGEGELDNRELYEERLQELERNNYQFIEELGVRHTEEMERLRSDYEVLLELAVKEKENEMRNTIIENEELEDLAAQVEDLTQSLTDKEKEIKRQQDTISNLMDEIKLLKDKKASVPMPLPQIIIEDPEGEVRCSACCKKSGEIKKLKENIEEAKSDFKEYCSTTAKGFSDAECCIKDLKKVNMDVKNDLNSMKSELANFSAEIKDAFSALELETTKSTSEPTPLIDNSTQTEAPPKSRVLPQPNVSRETSSSESAEPADLSSCREAQTSTSNLSSAEDKGFKEKEAKYKKDIFDLKVKLKELEVKMNHIKKKADEIKNDSKDQVISENLSNDKLMELVRDKERALQQARRLHGANVATMRKRHDKAVGNLQATIDQLTVTLQQFVPGYNTVTSDRGSTDRISVTCRQGRFSACTVITDNLNNR